MPFHQPSDGCALEKKLKVESGLLEAHHGRTMNLLERITIEPGKCGGRPCIRGYRIRVSDILDLIAAGASREEILADYDFLEADDITAALTYAARQTDHTVLAVAA